MFPRLVAAEHRRIADAAKLPVEHRGARRAARRRHRGRHQHADRRRAPGTGKSTLAAQFCGAAAARGEHVAHVHLRREPEHAAHALRRACGIDLEEQVDGRQRSTIVQVDPAELSPGEFAHAIREAVEATRRQVVVIDSLNGYLNAMPEERFLTIQLHELLMYLGQQGVATILIGAQQGLIGTQMQTPVDASYLADAVILLRYFEAKGEVRQAISVVKKRGGAHERTIREFAMHDGRHPRRRAAARVPRRPDRRAGLRRLDRPAARHRAAHDDATSARDRRLLILAPTARDGGDHARAANGAGHRDASVHRRSTRWSTRLERRRGGGPGRRGAPVGERSKRRSRRGCAAAAVVGPAVLS